MRILISLLVLFTLLGAQKKIEDKVIAKVDGEVILQSDLDEFIISSKQQLPPGVSEEELRKQALDFLIKQKILLVEAKRDTTIQISNEEVERQFKERWRTLEQEMGKERLQEELKKAGLTKEDLKKELREELLIQHLIEKKIKPKVKVTDKEVIEFYKNYKDSIPEKPTMVRVAHILIKISPSPPRVEEAKKRAQGLYEKLRKGEDFALLASRYSDDEASAQLGGDIGYVRKQDLPPDIRNKVFSLEPGDISRPIRGDYGFHIFKCEEKSGNVIRLRQIFIEIKPTSKDSAEALKRARAIKKKIEGGMSFEDLAQKYSDDPNTRDIGGDLGWLPIGQFPEPLRDTLENMKVGEIKGPIPSPYGFHIVKLIDRREGGKPTFEEVRDQIMQLLYSRKLQEEIDKYVEKAKKRIYIKIMG